MFAPIARAGLRAAPSSLRTARTCAGRRFISTQPPHLRSRSWKSSAARWGIAVAGIYYYNTSPVFAEQPQHNLLNPNLDALDDAENTPTLDTLTSRRARQPNQNAQKLHSAVDATSSENASTSVAAPEIDAVGGGAAELEEEAEGEGAFNPETGEINWDCPCLGGMAHGPCGPQFREAFSCFIFSTEEPKGMDCIEKFQGMRDCFQEHPDVYKDELMEDEEIDREVEAERQELAQQIAERQKSNEESGRRLLEEPASESRPKRSSKPAQQPSSQAASDSTVLESKAAEATIPTPYTALATDASTSGHDVIPEAAHNATQVATADGNEKIER